LILQLVQNYSYSLANFSNHLLSSHIWVNLNHSSNKN
jgi:hypothetical protein